MLDDFLVWCGKRLCVCVCVFVFVRDLRLRGVNLWWIVGT